MKVKYADEIAAQTKPPQIVIGTRPRTTIRGKLTKKANMVQLALQTTCQMYYNLLTFVQ